MGSSKQKAPDVVGAAREEGEQARALAAEETIANRPDQYNPWGSTTWNAVPTWDPVTGQMVNRWTQTETLNPQLQAMLDAQLGVGQQRSELASQLMGRAAETMGSPMDWSQFGGPVQMRDVSGVGQFQFDPGTFRQQAEDAAYARAASRLDPQFQAREQELITRLNNQGLRPGDRAYDSAISNFERSRADAYEQARLGAVGEGRAESDLSFGQQLGAYQAMLAGQGQEFGQAMSQAELANALRTQAIQEELFRRGQDLGQVNQLLSGFQLSGGTPSGSIQGGQT